MAAPKVIEDSVVARILADKALLARLPAVAAAGVPRAPAKTGCGGCSQAQAPRVDYLAVKKVIAKLPDGQLAALKQFLGAETVKVSYPLHGGRIAHTTR